MMQPPNGLGLAEHAGFLLPPFTLAPCPHPWERDVVEDGVLGQGEQIPIPITPMAV